MSAAAGMGSRYRVRLDAELPGPMLGEPTWRATAERGDTRTVFQQLHWQRCWWQSYGRGELIVASVSNERGVVAIAPLFVDGGMAFFVGSGGSDYLDFIGDVASPGVLEALLAAVQDQVPGLLGFRFYHVPASSRTGARLHEAAARLGLSCVGEGGQVAPVLDLGPTGAAGLRAAQKRSLLRHERALARAGSLSVDHLRDAAQILPLLDAFFDQHLRRWQATPHPSLFCEPVHRDFYRRLAAGADGVDWLRFTVVALDGRPIAFHFGFSLAGSTLWYKPSFEIELARKSPGEVLLRQLLLAAVHEKARVFDFGLGDEAFKHRFANRVLQLETWGLYPRSGS